MQTGIVKEPQQIFSYEKQHRPRGLENTDNNIILDTNTIFGLSNVTKRQGASRNIGLSSNHKDSVS